MYSTHNVYKIEKQNEDFLIEKKRIKKKINKCTQQV